MTNADEDCISYFIVVDGIEEETTSLLREYFPNVRSGVRPDTLIPYRSIPCEINEIENTLARITKNLTNSHSETCLIISINSLRNWANFYVPHQLIGLVQKYQIDLKISFLSPARKRNSDSPAEA